VVTRYGTRSRFFPFGAASKLYDVDRWVALVPAQAWRRWWLRPDLLNQAPRAVAVPPPAVVNLVAPRVQRRGARVDARRRPRRSPLIRPNRCTLVGGGGGPRRGGGHCGGLSCARPVWRSAATSRARRRAVCWRQLGAAAGQTAATGLRVGRGGYRGRARRGGAPPWATAGRPTAGRRGVPCVRLAQRPPRPTQRVLSVWWRCVSCFSVSPACPHHPLLIYLPAVPLPRLTPNVHTRRRAPRAPAFASGSALCPSASSCAGASSCARAPTEHHSGGSRHAAPPQRPPVFGASTPSTSTGRSSLDLTTGSFSALWELLHLVGLS